MIFSNFDFWVCCVCFIRDELMWDWSRNAIIVNVFLISDGNPDIIEEAIYYFKANVFFKSYEIKVFI